MNYVIKNSKGLYVKLDGNGTPTTCAKNDSTLFEFSKAKNIIDHLPKTMRKFHFKVEPVPEITGDDNKVNKEKTVISNDSVLREEYILSESVTRWIEKFGTCEDVFVEADEREKQLLSDLRKSDEELMDILHIIEIQKPKDLYGGWLLYKQIKNNRKKRRDIKDELIIVENVLGTIKNTSCLHRKNIKRAIEGLYDRKYTFRVVEEEGNGMQEM